MTRARATIPGRRRLRERMAVVAVVAIAAGAGLLAAHFGTHRSWEIAPTAASTSTSVPTVDPQGNP
jgi:hypothetical protein